MNNFEPLFLSALCVPLPFSLNLSFYLFVVSIANTFTHLQSVGSDFPSPFLSLCLPSPSFYPFAIPKQKEQQCPRRAEGSKKEPTRQGPLLSAFGVSSETLFSFKRSVSSSSNCHKRSFTGSNWVLPCFSPKSIPLDRFKCPIKHILLIPQILVQEFRLFRTISLSTDTSKPGEEGGEGGELGEDWGR